jgi:predicted nucleic acid-binding protein
VILLDTNVLSEWLHYPTADAVLRWANGLPQAAFFTTAITVAELRVGVRTMPEGARRSRLDTAVETMVTRRLAGRVLPFDEAAAAAYARFVAYRRSIGRPADTSDAMIAAIAITARAEAIATRNTSDFEGCGVALVNPWDA